MASTCTIILNPPIPHWNTIFLGNQKSVRDSVTPPLSGKIWIPPRARDFISQTSSNPCEILTGLWLAIDFIINIPHASPVVFSLLLRSCGETRSPWIPLLSGGSWYWSWRGTTVSSERPPPPCRLPSSSSSDTERFLAEIWAVVWDSSTAMRGIVSTCQLWFQ